MAADHRKKRTNAASWLGCTYHEQYRVNGKKLQVQQHIQNMRSNISLEWDNKKKCVVSKREQIGIAQRHLIPFIKPGSGGPNTLADVFSVPQEIFDLKNLTWVMSYEVWQSHLSDKERTFLSQFLPDKPEPDAIVRDLLSGDNFHFGNPFSKWVASLCLGKLHPDNVLHGELCLKTSKSVYYAQLQKYHNDMIENLLSWKEKWASCEDPELDIVQNTSSREHEEQSVPSLEAGLLATEENLVATPESCYWVNSEMADSSDNHNSRMEHGEARTRKNCLNKPAGYSSNGLEVTAVPKKGERIHKRNVQNADGAIYWSYIKISKEQHERVKSSMKHAGNSIQPRSLNNVLGSIDTLNVQPFERFEEEERKKLNEHWLKLASKDIPEGYVNWRKRQFQKQELIRFLCEEIGQKLGHQEAVTLDEERVGFHVKQMELSDREKEILPSITTKVVGEELTDNLLQERRATEGAIPEMTTGIKMTSTGLLYNYPDERELKDECIIEHQTHDHTEIIEDKEIPDHVLIQDHNERQIASLDNKLGSILVTAPSSGLLQDRHQQQISSLDRNPRSSSMEMDFCHSNAGAETDEDPPIVSQLPENSNHADIPVKQGLGDPLSSVCDVWPVGDGHGSFYQSTAANDGYAFAQELPIGHLQFLQGQTVQMLDLESARQDKDAEDLRHRQPGDLSFFCSYSNQDPNELLQSVLEGQRNASCHQQPKHSGLEFHPGNDLMIEADHLCGHCREEVHPSLPLELRQKSLNNIYVSENVQETSYSGGAFTMPSQDHLSVSIHDWAIVNNVRMPEAPSRPHPNGGGLSQSCYTGENGTRDGLPSFEVSVGANHSLSSRSDLDQTLFSVLSECNDIRPCASYASMRCVEPLIRAGNLGGIGRGIPSSNNFLQQSQSPIALNYLSSHDATVGLKMNNIGWTGMPQRNSGIQESTNKPFLRTWNQ